MIFTREYFSELYINSLTIYNLVYILIVFAIFYINYAFNLLKRENKNPLQKRIIVKNNILLLE